MLWKATAWSTMARFLQMPGIPGHGRARMTVEVLAKVAYHGEKWGGPGQGGGGGGGYDSNEGMVNGAPRIPRV